MLKVSCNGTDPIQALAQCRFQAPPRSLFARRRSDFVLFSRETKTAPVLAVVSDRGGVGLDCAVTGVEPGLGTLADRLRLGSLTEDGLSYKEKFIVRSYEVGIHKMATVGPLPISYRRLDIIMLRDFRQMVLQQPLR